MKRNLSHMLMAITLTMAFTGCQSTPDVVTEVTKEETPQRITITLHLADIAESRATGNPSVVDAWGQQVDCRLSQLLFATFDDDGKLLSNHADTYEQDKVYRFTTYRSATKLVIFANVSATTLWDIANCSELSSTNFGGLSADQYSAIPMVGEAPIIITEDMNETTTIISLHRLMARIGVKNVDVNIPEDVGSFEPTEVFAHHVNEHHAFFDHDNGWQGRSFSLLNNGSSGEYNVAGSMPLLGSGASANFYRPRAEIPDTWQYFYVYPHEKENATRLVVKGMFTDTENVQSTMYYPVVVNHMYETITEGDTQYRYGTDIYPNDSRLEANKTYMLDLTITGKGVSSPDDDISIERPAIINFEVGKYQRVNQTTVINLEQPDGDMTFKVTIEIADYQPAEQVWEFH